MPRNRSLLMVFGMSLLFLGCRSTPPAPELTRVCECGNAETDVLGCAATCCEKGHDACSKPVCTCEPSKSEEPR